MRRIGISDDSMKRLRPTGSSWELTPWRANKSSGLLGHDAEVAGQAVGPRSHRWWPAAFEYCAHVKTAGQGYFAVTGSPYQHHLFRTVRHRLPEPSGEMPAKVDCGIPQPAIGKRVSPLPGLAHRMRRWRRGSAPVEPASNAGRTRLCRVRSAEDLCAHTVPAAARLAEPVRIQERCRRGCRKIGAQQSVRSSADSFSLSV